MGDRCSMVVYVKPEDVNKFCEITKLAGPKEFSETSEYRERIPGYFHAELEEVNYAAKAELDNAAKAGLEFFGYHGSGGDYAAGEFYAKDGVVHAIPLSHKNPYVLLMKVDGVWVVDTTSFYAIRDFKKHWEELTGGLI